ncbi:Stk1 family PASTA domain-containing Ser/Thr kinase [Sporolactobacillus kofuensis]|uniref:non-specific serine/threonine protein kinase n=1 Tax=Sporolactobacillus kofuensis TaxID=269672 RepID=A0ABW1WAI7_9BACL|nr:Stk1 family PASTA domain-containing Ser/Thr kinase [Sporolactobacillus kofuensis]MCO7174653.1 Stk1 family PASTA domain-containing Ser/Thr kinase [Sporolactobacillus kofuensis]
MIGKRVGGRYQILSRLGEGGMAIVYKAKDLILDRLVAVKTLRQELADDEEFVRRFRREAESVASLSHPNIVAIYDIGEEDCYYIVMEYIEGMTLKEFIKDYSPIAINETIHIMKQILQAIAHAHDHGIVHRDIKPQNILINESEQVKVTDFGIALAVSSATITYTHSIMGSAHYLSPEQAKGGKATIKSDIYALGIVMFELLTGKLPFPGTSPVSVALKHLSSPMPFPRDFRNDIPQSIENIVIRALAKDPAERYEYVTEMYDDLNTALDPERANEKRLILNEPNSDEETADNEKTIKMTPIVEHEMNKNAVNAEAPQSENSKKEKQPKKSKAKKWLTISGILLLLITAGLILGMTLLPKLFYVSNVRVPDVTGKTYQEARNALNAQQLKVVRSDRVSNSIAKGKVISQNPESGEEVKEGTEINVIVSKGSKMVSLDNYVGYSRDTVTSAIKDAGFKKVVWHETSTSPDTPEGEIIRQNPSAGTKVVPADTILELTYSPENQEITVPDLKGKTKNDARKLLKAQGLNADFSNSDYSDDVAKGSVLDQDPASGSQVEKGASIVVTLSKGKEPKPKGIDQPIKVIYPGDKGSSAASGESKTPIHVQIYYTDANHNNSVFTDEEITETKTYTIPFMINPNEKGTYRVLIDGTERKTGTVDYPDEHGASLH